MKYCRFCNKILTGNKVNTFCNRSCAASFNNKGRVRNPRNLADDISSKIGYPWIRIEEELQYCQTLCKKCHREKTTKEQKSSKHGSIRKYINYKCRCDICKEVGRRISRKRREWRQQRRELGLKVT